MSRMSLALAAAWAGLVFLSADRPLGATPQEPYREQIEVTEVKVPVNVIRNGAPVRGLTRDDFRIVAGGQRREIVGFTVVDLAEIDPAVAQAAAELPLPARRHFMLLFDLAFSNPSAIVRARHAAIELVEEGLHPTDLVGVALFAGRFGFKVPLGFTDDREQVKLAIATLGLPGLVQSYRRFATSAPESPDISAPVNPRLAQLMDPGVQSQLDAMVVEMERATQRHLAMGLTTSLGELAEAFGAISGRKQVIYLSEGFPGSLVSGPDVRTERGRQETQGMSEDAMSGFFSLVDSDRRFGSVEQRNRLDLTLERFVEADAAVHSVDVGGIRAGDLLTGEPSAPGEDTLFIMADRTGGDFLRNYNNLNQAMGEVLERTSVTYLLSFRIPESERDGQLRRIKVKLKQGGKGARLLYRPSYRADTD